MEQFGAAKLPKEMSFHVPKGSKFTDLYNFITFPVTHIDRNNLKDNVLVRKHHVICEPVGMENMKPETLDNVIKSSNTTTSEQVTRAKGRRQHNSSPTLIITTTPVPDKTKTTTVREGVVKERSNYCVKSSKGTKVKLISFIIII